MDRTVRTAYIWYGRFVATAVLLYSAFLLIVTIANLIAGSEYESAAIVIWIVASAVLGLVAAPVFLLTFDGPSLFRTRRIRVWSWLVMFLAILLPTSISFFLAPLTAAAIGLVLTQPSAPTEPTPAQ